MRGSFLKQAYSMSYKLISHVVAASRAAGYLRGAGAAGRDRDQRARAPTVPTHDVVVLALRELTKLKQGR